MYTWLLFAHASFLSSVALEVQGRSEQWNGSTGWKWTIEWKYRVEVNNGME